jgi:hypothetical protein
VTALILQMRVSLDPVMRRRCHRRAATTATAATPFRSRFCLKEMASAGSSSDRGSAFSLMKRFGQVSSMASDQDVRLMARYCEMCKHLLRERVADLVAEADGAPLLRHYRSDGTPVSTKHRYAVQLRQGSKVKREGKATDEYLVQHAFFRYIDAGSRARTTVMLRDPMPLTHGKGAVACLSAGLAFLVHPRQLGHVGIVVSHYLFDRALLQALSRLFDKHHHYSA